MDEIIEHFGASLLAIFVSERMIRIYFSLIAAGGALHMIVSNFMDSICG